MRSLSSLDTEGWSTAVCLGPREAGDGLSASGTRRLQHPKL